MEQEPGKGKACKLDRRPVNKKHSTDMFSVVYLLNLQELSLDMEHDKEFQSS